MADAFDPYYTWLAIPPAEQPPDLYRLVGVTRFEENLDVISYAVDQRMSHLRTFQVGKHSQHSQKILNELAGARIVLLEPEKKAAYDQQLHLAHAAKAPPRPLPRAKATIGVAAEPAPVLTPVPAQAFPPAATVHVPVRNNPRDTSSQKGIILAVVTGVLVLLIGVGIIFAFRGGDEQPVVVNPEQVSPGDPPPKPPGSTPVNDNVKPAPITPWSPPVPAKPPAVPPKPPMVEVNPAFKNLPPASSASGNRYVLGLEQAAFLELADTSNFATLDRSFTAEVWARWSVPNNGVYLFGNLPHTPNATPDIPNAWGALITGQSIRVNMGRDGGNMAISASADAPSDQQWHHVAVCGDGAKLRVYLDGKLLFEEVVNLSPGGPRRTNFYLGSPSVGLPGGYRQYSAFRLSNSCRYTSSFTPARVLENDKDVIALLDLTTQTSLVEDLAGKGHAGRMTDASWIETSEDVPSAKAGSGSSPATAIAKNDTPSNPSSVAEPRAPIVGTQFAPINLLQRIDMSKDVLQGSLGMNNGRLITGGNQLDFVQINVPLPREYVLEAIVTRKTNLDMLGFGLVIGNKKCVFSVDAYPSFGNFSGLSSVDRKSLHHSDYPSAHRGTLLTNERPARLRFAVTGNSLKAFCDGREIYHWEGNPDGLGILKNSYVATNAPLFLTSSHSVYEISELRLLPYDESAPGPTDSTGVASAAPPAKSLITPPDEAAAKKAREDTRKILQDDYAAARRPDEKVNLARKLSDLARTTRDDTTTQYVLWEDAWHGALEGGNLVLALAIIEEEASLYDIDRSERELEAIKQVVPLARTTPDRKLLGETALKVANDACASAKYDYAEQAIRIAGAAAAKAGDGKLKTEIATRAKQIDELQKQITLANQAAERLKTDPENPKANFVYGKYLCRVKGDWAAGLAHLKKGGEAALVAVIDADLAKPTDNDKRLAVGDKWWTQGLGSSGDEKLLMLARAHHWYEQVVGQLNGLNKERIAKRIKDIQAEVPPNMLGKGTDVAAADAGGRTIDMLKLIDTTRDAIKGNWRMQNGVLLCESQHLVPKIYMPYIPPEEYDVKVVFSQPVIRHDLCIIAPKAGASVAWYLGGDTGKIGFLVQPKNGGVNPTQRLLGSFVANRRYTTVLQVRDAGVAAFIDGVEVARYATDYSDMRPDVFRAIPDRTRLAIGADDPTIFHAIEVTEVTGAGRVLKD